MSTDVRDPRGFAEDGFHEIQLSGKQLAFLFMATTVVSIVIFICGVLVGQKLRAEGPGTGTGPAGMAERHDAGVEGEEGTAAEPALPPTQEALKPDELRYHDRLQAEAMPVDEILPDTPAPEPVAAPVPPPARPAAAPKAAPATTRVTAAAGAPEGAAAPAPARAARPAGAWTVQVTALRQRTDADAMARRLVGRGYDAYVDATTSGVPMYRVRVGSFTDQREAERMKERLERNEKFNPFITK
jgi:DedD protein